jgi:hypothetical protein
MSRITGTRVRPRPHGRWALCCAGGVVLAWLIFAGAALAKEPTGDFAVFNQCPRFAGANFCVYSQIKSGEVTIASTTVPIVNTITLQGGYFRNEAVEPPTETFIAAVNGETLSKSPEPVPGGLAGLIKCTEIEGEGLVEKAARAACKAVFENALTGVNATTELAKPASAIGISTDNLLNQEGVALSLPARVKLENPFLGSECYIGSSSLPLTLNLTTGTTSPPPPNKPISGKVGDLEFKDEFELIEITNNTLVDNAFLAPKASGCGGIFAFLVDPIVNKKLGLPSPEGTNTAIQTGTQRLASAETVIKSEK